MNLRTATRLLLLGGTGLAFCLAASPEGEAERLLQVLAGAPELQAVQARAEAARERVPAAGLLPDAEAEAMFSEAKDPTSRYSMWEVRLRQPLPKAGELRALRDQAKARLGVADADYTMKAADLAMAVAMAIAERDAAEARSAVLVRQADRMEGLLAAIASRIATGSGISSEQLVLQARIESMRLMAEQERQMASDAENSVRALLALTAEAKMPAFAAPDRASVSAGRSPQALAGQSRVHEARAMADMAKAEGRPMTALGVSFSREAMPEARKDVVGLSFMTDLPWRSRRAARANLKAARAEERAGQAEVRAAGPQLEALLARLERTEGLAAQAARTADAILLRGEAEYEAFSRRLGVAAMGGETPLLMLMEIIDRETQARIQKIDSEARVRLVRAELWRFAPSSLFESIRP